jgi:hypothetical protein
MAEQRFSKPGREEFPFTSGLSGGNTPSSKDCWRAQSRVRAPVHSSNGFKRCKSGTLRLYMRLINAYRRALQATPLQKHIPPYAKTNRANYAASGCAVWRNTLPWSTSASIFLPRNSIRTLTRSLAGRTLTTTASSPANMPSEILTRSPCERS